MYNYLIIKVYYTAQKMLLLNFQNSQMKKQGATLFLRVYVLWKGIPMCSTLGPACHKFVL